MRGQRQVVIDSVSEQLCVMAREQWPNARIIGSSDETLAYDYPYFYSAQHSLPWLAVPEEWYEKAWQLADYEGALDELEENGCDCDECVDAEEEQKEQHHETQ